MKEIKYRMTRSILTININDIKNHNNWKHEWWDKEHDKINLLHRYNPLRVQFVRSLANIGFKEQTTSLPLQGFKITDIGCSGGILTEILARIGIQVTGIDASEELINVAKKHAALDPDITKRINYIYTTIEEFSS